jgi:hypothetical protein
MADAKPGDRVLLASRKVGQPPRSGTVQEVRRSMLTVQWDNGERTTFTPTSGSLAVLPANAKSTS